MHECMYICMHAGVLVYASMPTEGREFQEPISGRGHSLVELEDRLGPSARSARHDAAVHDPAAPPAK
jgi:hypothetical protein